jgi:hypothetical protein
MRSWGQATTRAKEWSGRTVTYFDPILRGLDRLDALLRRESPPPPPDHPALAAMDCHAQFRCNALELPATVCAAVGFAKASGGNHRGPSEQSHPRSRRGYRLCLPRESGASLTSRFNGAVYGVSLLQLITHHLHHCLP